MSPHCDTLRLLKCIEFCRKRRRFLENDGSYKTRNYFINTSPALVPWIPLFPNNPTQDRGWYKP